MNAASAAPMAPTPNRLTDLHALAAITRPPVVLLIRAILIFMGPVARGCGAILL
jgi:hypothetical protein